MACVYSIYLQAEVDNNPTFINVVPVISIKVGNQSNKLALPVISTSPSWSNSFAVGANKDVVSSSSGILGTLVDGLFRYDSK